MALLSYRSRVSVRSTDYDNEPVTFDVHNWRMLKYGLLYSDHHRRSEMGVMVSALEHVRMLPHVNIKDVMEFNSRGREARVNQYHTRYEGTVFPFCWDCNGAGKFDWVQATCVDKRYPPQDAVKRFVRDERYVYMNPDYDDLVFAKAHLEPGESYCKLCRGFGVMIDGRFKIFKGMAGLRDGLVQVEATI